MCSPDRLLVCTSSWTKSILMTSSIKGSFYCFFLKFEFWNFKTVSEIESHISGPCSNPVWRSFCFDCEGHTRVLAKTCRRHRRRLKVHTCLITGITALCGPVCERLMDEGSCSDSPRGAVSPHPLLSWQLSEESRRTKDECHIHLR